MFSRQFMLSERPLPSSDLKLGIDGVLMNTAIAGAKDPVRMARAMKAGVEAGRDAFLAGRIQRKLYATASSPLEGVIGSEQSGRS